jgi:hypothetical protein
MQLAFRDEGTLLNLDKTCVCFQVKYAGAGIGTTDGSNLGVLPNNILNLMRPVSC